MLFHKPACDWLIVGLGNPGDNYARTRHNAGFRAVDALAKELDAKIDRAKFRGLSCIITWRGQKLLLLKPQTFMNQSGLSVMDAAGSIGFRRSGLSSCLTISLSRWGACGCGRRALPGATMESNPSSAA